MKESEKIVSSVQIEEKKEGKRENTAVSDFSSQCHCVFGNLGGSSAAVLGKFSVCMFSIGGFHGICGQTHAAQS